VKAIPRPPEAGGVTSDASPDSNPNPDPTAEPGAVSGSESQSGSESGPQFESGPGVEPGDADVAADPTADADGGSGGYVHTPGGPAGPDADSTRRAEPEPTGFGAAGWLLTAAVVVCFLLIPGVIYAYPYVLGVTGLGFLGTYLALPLVPAVLLGLLAVWSMSAAR